MRTEKFNNGGSSVQVLFLMFATIPNPRQYERKVYERKEKMLGSISIEAKKILEQIAKKRVGRTLEALELAGASEHLKNAIKKQIWEFKNDVESKVLESGDNYDNKKQNN